MSHHKLLVVGATGHVGLQVAIRGNLVVRQGMTELLVPGAPPSVRGDIYALGVLLYQLSCGDFLDLPSPGWEARIPDLLLQEDIAAAANIDPDHRLSSAAELAVRLSTLEQRRSERKRFEDNRALAARAEQEMARARLRRPWIYIAVSALVVGFCASVWFYHGAVEQRNAALSRSATLAAMNDFLTVDLLDQSNPMTAPVSADHGSQETLLEAIDQALPKVDQRFASDPIVAAGIHETLGAALDARTLYAESDKQFALAAERFRQAEGPLSQNAIICELRRENAQFRTQLSGPIAEAKLGFAAQEKVISQLRDVSPELQAWAALAETGTQIYGDKPEQALGVLSAAVTRAEKTPGFSPSLLTTLRLRFCGVDARLGRFEDMERVAREILAEEWTRNGETAAIFQPEIFLEEALLEQGKYKAAIEQSNHDFPQFSRALGPSHQLTLASLDVRAQAEGESQDYAAAIRDDLALHTAASAVPSGQFLAEDSLNLAAQLSCRTGQYEAGINYAREVLREAGSGPSAQPYFKSVASLAIAECLISRKESLSNQDPADLENISHLLEAVDVVAMTQQPGMGDSKAILALTRARFDILAGRLQAAETEMAVAAPALTRSGADPYEVRILTRTQSRLQQLSRRTP